MEDRNAERPQVGDTVRDPNGVVYRVEQVNGGMAYIRHESGTGMWVWRDMLEVVR